MPKVIQMMLCETEHLILHPNVLYRFKVAKGCVRCKELERIGTPPTPKKAKGGNDADVQSNEKADN